MNAAGELRLFRYVPGDSPAHRMWAGTKLVALAALSLGVGVKASWTAEGVLAAVVLLFALTARLPRTVLPRIPRWLWIGLLIGALIALVSGGSPNLHLGWLTLGLGGLGRWIRFTVLAVLVAAMSALIGWTTRLADIAPAVRILAIPARWLRLPTEEFVLAIGLGVRCLPLLADEFRTLRAAWWIRGPAARPGVRGAKARARDVRDLLGTAMVSSVRRAREMADAIEARGGPGPVRAEPVRVGLADAIALALAAAAVMAMAAL